MTRTRLLLAGLVAAALLAWAVPVDAGVLITIDAETTCTDDGEYEITYTIENLATEDGFDANLTVQSFQVDGEDATPPTFSPNPVPADSSSTATVTVPGDTTALFIEIEAEFPQGQFGTLENETALDGDCEPAPTTTTSTTVPAEPVTPAPAAQPRTVTPAFTG